MVPEPRRFSTPRPSSFPMMSVMMYLEHTWKHTRASESSSGQFPAVAKDVIPGLATFLYMVAVNSVGGADACVVLRCQVKVLETLQDNRMIYFLFVFFFTIYS